MSLDFYRLSVTSFLHRLGNLDRILEKAIAHCAAKDIDPATLLEARLAPDMLNFTRQVQLACDFAKWASARLAGVEAPAYEDNETSFEALRARIAKTIAFLETLPQAAFAEAAGRDIVLAMRQMTLEFKGDVYLIDFALPNFYFHFTTAYDLLRHKGVEIGKQDFIGKVQ